MAHAKKQAPRKDLTQEELKSILHYDPETGHFTWLVDRNGRKLTGKRAGGYEPIGYIVITLGCARYKAHRLAWLYMYGNFPEEFIDHINGDRADNRISNLRSVTRAQNTLNSKMRKTSRRKVRGVQKIKESKVRPYVAYIFVNNKRKHLGSYATEEEAHEAYKKAAGEFYNPDSGPKQGEA